MQNKSMLRITVILISGAVIIIGYVKYIENQGVFFPLRNVETTPAAINLAFKDVYVNAADNIRVNGWFIPAKNAKYTILFFHGNAGNLSHRMEKIKIFHDLNLNMFIIDYRGYGKSKGRPSEKGLYLDGDAAYHYLTEIAKINPNSIILYGESLGGSVAIALAQKSEVKALITEETFSSLRDMAKTIYPYLPSFFVSDKFNSLARVQKISVPKLFIHSKNDEIVPFYLAEKLYRQAKEPKQFAIIHGGHNDAFYESKNEYIESIRKFIEGLS